MKLFHAVSVLFLVMVAAISLVGCGSDVSGGGGMPWKTGEPGVDSLLDMADRIELSENYDETALGKVLTAVAGHGAANESEALSAARYFADARLLELSGKTGDVYKCDEMGLAFIDASNHPYLAARLRLHMAMFEDNLERKTDELFGVLPSFVDARDSMRVVETLYELQKAYGRVWDNATQMDYMREIIRYVPDSLQMLRAVMRSNLIRMERNRADTVEYLKTLDSLRREKVLTRLAPALGVMVYSDLYRLRGDSLDLDTAAAYMSALEIRHPSERVFWIQKLSRFTGLSMADSAARYASLLLAELDDDEDDSLDMETMTALIPYFSFSGDELAVDTLSRRLGRARHNVDAYERALKMARMNVDRRINEFRSYSENSMSRHRTSSIIWIVVIVLLVIVLPAMGFIVWLKTRHNRRNDELRHDLDNTKRRLTVAQLQNAEKDRALSSVLGDLDSLTAQEGGQKDAESLRRKLRLQLTGDDDWERFSVVFTDMRPGFVDNLKSAYPQLTRGDIRLCCLLEMGLDTKHIAKLLMIRPESVKKHRQRLRAKFGLTPEVKWSDFFANF